jgi:hypothetical protein
MVYVPGTLETDPKKQNISLQQNAAANKANAANIATNTADIATHTADIATNASNIAANTAAIATNTAAIATNTAAIAKLTNNQFARVARVTSNQTGLTVGTLNKIQFNAVMFDPSSIWDAANYRFKPTIAGYYRVSWGAQVTYTAGSFAYVAAVINGSRYAIGSLVDDAPTFSDSVGTTIAHFDGTTNYVEAHAYYGTGSAGSVTAGSDISYFDISLVKAD